MMRAVCLLAAALAAGACHRAAGPAPAPIGAPEPLLARDFYPLAAGNRWEWEVREPGPPSGWSTPRTSQRTVETVGEEDGFWRDTAGGMLRADAWGLRDRDRYLLRDPVVAGTKWTNVVSLQSTERYEILEAGRPCTVRAGTFGRCVVVRGTNRIDPRRTMSTEWTFAQGIGLVRVQTALESAQGVSAPQMEMELLSFRPGPAR